MIKILILFTMLNSSITFASDYVRVENYKPITTPQDVKISLSNNTYLVSNVYVQGDAESEAQAFDNGLQEAKFIAFRALKNKIHDNFLAEDIETIDSAMVGFVPASGHFEDGKYVAKFEILFDKEKIATLITENRMIGQQRARFGNESIVAKVSIKNDVNNWVKIRKRLDPAQIKYSVISITLDEVELLFKNVNYEVLYNDLKAVDLELVQNRDFYFIRVPFF